MSTISINEVGKIGVVYDRYPHELPPNAWSEGRNIRARDGFIEKILGESQVLGSPGVAPYNLIPVSYGTQYFWLYAGLTKAYAIESGTHADITRVSGDYISTVDKNWTMTNFQGLPVLNNSFDIPQVWTPPSLGTKLVDLPNWNTTWLANSVRAFKQFLVALRISKASTLYPRMVKWSHPAVSGAVPSSWDETDPTKDAGEYELSDTDGYVIDGLPLRDVFVIYKEDAVWGMQFVGGAKIMRFFKIFDGIGIMGPRCVAEFFFGKHLVFGTDDIYVHDGQNRESILSDRMRRAFYSQASFETFDRAFVGLNQNFQEVWCCAPTGSSELANLAVVWNWKDNTLVLRELPGVSGAAVGLVSVPTGETWDGDSAVWDSDTTVWDDRFFNPLSRRMVLVRPSAPNFLLTDDTAKFESSNMTAYVERTGLGVPFRSDKPPDTSSMKMITALWPRIEGTNGGVVKVYVGSQHEVNGPVTYNSPVDFVIGTTKQIPCRATGRTLALKFLSDSDISWRLHGYDMDVKPVGRF